MAENEIQEELNVGSMEQIKALTHPLRQRIFERLAIEPASAKQVAVRLGEKPTRLYHHVNILEQAGLIKLVETRQRRGATEKIYSAVARRIRLDPSGLVAAGLASSTRNQTQLDAIDMVFERTRSEVAELIAQQPDSLEDLEEGSEEQEEALFAWVEVRCKEEELPELRQKLESLLNHDVGRGSNPPEDATERYRLLLGFYPIPESEEP